MPALPMFASDLLRRARPPSASLLALICTSAVMACEKNPAEPVAESSQPTALSTSGGGSYAVVNLGTLAHHPAGAPKSSFASAINNWGQVVGRSDWMDNEELRTTVSEAFLWQNGVMIGLGTLPGHTHSSAHAVNNLGQVVGTSSPSRISAEGRRAFLWDRGTMIDLGVLPGYDFSEAYDINDRGHVVGRSTVIATGTTRAFLWEDGKMTDLGVYPGFENSSAGSINNAGQVLGFSREHSGPHTTWGMQRTFLWKNGAMVHLPTPSGYEHAGSGVINDSGTLVNSAWTGSWIQMRTFLWNHEVASEIGSIPGALRITPAGLNNVGQVVINTVERGGGFYGDTYRAFVWQNGSTKELPPYGPPPYAFAIASDINDRGQVVGHGMPFDDFDLEGSLARALLWNPVPKLVFSGFLPPVSAAPALNRSNAGAAVPIKFSLGGNRGMDIFASGYPQSRPISCQTLQPTGPGVLIETPGRSALSYDTRADQYGINWKTERGWSGTCRQLVLRLSDGSEHTANFHFR